MLDEPLRTGPGIYRREDEIAPADRGSKQRIDLEPAGATNEGQQRNVTRALDCGRERSLMLSAGAGFAARLDFSTLGDIAAQTGKVLVVDLLDPVHAEL